MIDQFVSTLEKMLCFYCQKYLFLWNIISMNGSVVLDMQTRAKLGLAVVYLIKHGHGFITF